MQENKSGSFFMNTVYKSRILCRYKCCTEQPFWSDFH